MKKRYITPSTVAIAVMAHDGLLLPASENGYTDENLSRHYNQDDNVWDINGED
ncbi:MAG: hypothetical protein J6P41_01230 [Prevotella sp.]|nr:hypothetical protein [Prevotella sp.]